jgi:hypothetical protein
VKITDANREQLMNSFIAAVMRAQKQGQGVWHIDILSPETLVEDWLQLKQRPSARLRRQWKRTQEMIAGLYGSPSPGLCLLCDNGFATQDPAALAVLIATILLLPRNLNCDRSRHSLKMQGSNRDS